MDFPIVVVNRLTKEEVERYLFRSQKVNDHTAQGCELGHVHISESLSTQNKKKKKEVKICSVKYRKSLRSRGNDTRIGLRSSNSSVTRVVRYTFRKTLNGSTLTPSNAVKLDINNQKTIINNESNHAKKMGKNQHKIVINSHFDQSHFKNEVQIKDRKNLNVNNIQDSFVKETKKTHQRFSSSEKPKVKITKDKKKNVYTEKDLKKKKTQDSFFKETKRNYQRLSSSDKTQVKIKKDKKKNVSAKNINMFGIKDCNKDNLTVDYKQNQFESKIKNSTTSKEEGKACVTKESNLIYGVPFLKPCVGDIIESDLSEYKCKKKKRYDILNDELSSEIEIISGVKNVLFKIEGTESALLKNSNNKRKELGRVELVNDLINENKIVTIPIPVVPNETYLEADAQDVQIMKERKCDINVIPLISENNYKNIGEVGLIKLKSPETLGVVKEHKNEKINSQNDLRSMLVKFRKESDSKTDGICLLYHHYFNTHVKSLLNTLIKALSSALKQICENENDTSTKQTFVERNSQPNSEHVLILKKFSKHFVETFQKIQDTFEEIHKPQMIPIIYLHLLKAFENLGSVKLEDVRCIILRMFQIEDFINKYDILCKKSYEESKELLFIYERWIGKFLKEKIENETLSVHYSPSSANNVDNEYTAENISLVEDKISDVVEVGYDDTSLVIDLSYSNDQKAKVNSDVKVESSAVAILLHKVNKDSRSTCTRTNSDNKHDESSEKCINVFQEFNSGTFSGQQIQNQVTDDINIDADQPLTSDAEDQRIHIFQNQESASSLDCPNTSCDKKMTVPCYYCKEFIGCVDLCQVERDQFIGRSVRHNLQLLACKAHKKVDWEESCKQDWEQVEDHEMPYEPQCWHTACDKKAVIICLCKTRAYCTLMCREADWFSRHHQHCSWQTDSNLLLHLSDSD